MKRQHLILWLIALLIGTMSLSAQQKGYLLKGIVSDTTGEPLIGASVMVKGTATGVMTDIDGNFAVQVQDGQTVTFSYVGCLPQEVKVTGQNDIKVVLAEDNNVLEDVVVIGYGAMKKKDLTGAVTQIDPNKIADSNPGTVQDILRGAAGLQVEADFSAKGGGDMVLRGRNSLKTNSSPLIILDGMQFYGELSEINPDDIQQIDILKDSSSAAIYGAKAANGVIIITSKKGSNTGQPRVTLSANWGVVTKAGYRKYYDAEGYEQFRSDWYKRDTYGFDANGNYVAYGAENSRPAGYYDYPSAANLAKYGITMDEWLGQSVNAEGASIREVFGRRIGLDDEALLFQNYIDDVTYDWYDSAFRTGINQDYNVALSGGTDKMNYYMSVGYLKNQGVIKGNDYNTLRASMRLNGKINKFIEVGGNVNFQHRSDGDKALSYKDDLQQANIMKFSPYALPYDRETGELLQFPMGGTNRFQPFQNQPFYQNYEELEKGYMVLNSKFYVNVNLPFGITYQFNISPRYQYFWDRYFMSAELPNSNPVDRGVNREWGKRFDWNLNNTINWDYTFNDKHHVMLTLAQEAENRKFWSDRIEARNILPTDALGFHNTQNATKTNSNFKTNDTHESADALLARIFYAFDDRYMVTASVRRDGYSAFGAKYPHATFPSVALAWNFSNEKFFEPVADWWNLGKLRLSWGKNGNRDLGDPYIALANLGSGNGATMGYILNNMSYLDMKYLMMDRMANADLQWEKTEAYNAGLDFGFINNRINGSIDWYYKKTTDMIQSMRLPGFSGFGSVATNLGQVDNTGVELSINSLNITNSVLDWTTSLTFSYNKNTIKHINYEMEDVLDAQGNVIGQKEKDDSGNGWFIGHSIGEIWDYDVIGIWQPNEAAEAAKYNQRPGDPKVANYYTEDDKIDPVTGERTAVYNDKDKVFFGTKYAPMYLSMRNDFVLWKDFTISFTLYSRLGHKSQDREYANQDNASDIITHGLNTFVDEYWTPENPSNYYARLMSNGPVGATSPNRILNRNFLRLSDLTFGYTIPQKWTRKALIDKVRVTFGIKNLFTINPPKWSYGDPEATLGTRTFNFGINLAF